MPRKAKPSNYVRCGRCDAYVAILDKRYRPPSFRTLGKAQFLHGAGEAPRLRCQCGAMVVLMKGSLS